MSNRFPNLPRQLYRTYETNGKSWIADALFSLCWKETGRYGDEEVIPLACELFEREIQAARNLYRNKKKGIA